jgi:hypothetical protein
MKPTHVLKFPKDCTNHKYNLIHFQFFLQYAKIAGVTVEMVDTDDRVFIPGEHLVFSCTVNDQQIIVDYADHSTRDWQSFYPGIPYFKFQTTAANHSTVIPLGPPMVGLKKKGVKGATIRQYAQTRKQFQYNPARAILSKQIPNGAAVDRRKLVQDMLVTNFSNVDISTNDDQVDFWFKHQTCLAAVCVPGATNNMVDRGQMELMGLGVCTISPELKTLFPGRQLLTPGVHYIKCADDYSDLISIIKQLEKNPQHCFDIGIYAARFYTKNYTPKKYWNWILENLAEVEKSDD